MRLFDFLGPSDNEMNTLLSEILPSDLSDLHMLDLASGSGNHLQVFLDKNISKITVLDKSNDSLNYLKKRYEYDFEKIEIIVDDILTREHMNKYDLVYIGDNSIQMFESFHAQYQVILFVADAISAKGTGIINFTPVTEKNILEFSNNYTVISNADCLHGKIKVDIFEQELIYYFKSDGDIKTVRNRILIKNEFESMIEASGMYVSNVEKKICSSGNITYFYYCKRK